MFARLLILLAVLALATAGTWVIDSDTQATTAVGCGAGSSTQGIVGASQDGVGPIVDLFDGSVWTKKRNAVEAGLLMDAAISADGKTQLLSSMGGLFVSNDGGDSYSGVPGLVGISQDVHITEGIMSAVGNFLVPNADGGRPTSTSGVAFSTDGGDSWGAASIANEPNPRYGAFPSANTWYVSAGMWNTTESTYNVKSSTSHRQSHRVNIGSGKEHKVKMVGKVGDSTNGWYGALYKTTDGGATFTKQYSSPEGSMFYFNAISCSDENNCIAVAEGYNNDMTAPYAGVYQTTDGGANWKASWESNQIQGLMGCDMISNTEGWFAASPAQRSIATDFYHTTDGGATWTLEQSLSGCYALDMDMAGTLGVATCMNSSGSAMVAAHYQQ
jgi:photosystem II stability/assembly factor-like uncharacterized protein